MPFLTWQEVGDLKHILLEAANRLSEYGIYEQAEYIRGHVVMLEDIINKHESEDE